MPLKGHGIYPGSYPNLSYFKEIHSDFRITMLMSETQHRSVGSLGVLDEHPSDDLA